MRVRNAANIGIRILHQLAYELREKGYNVSEPATHAKSFGVAGMSCQATAGTLTISTWPPDIDDLWQIRTRRRHEEGGAAPTLHPDDMTDWNVIRQCLIEGVAKLDGAHDLQWVSIDEAEHPTAH